MPLLHLGSKRIHYTDRLPEGAAREALIFMHGLGSSQDDYYAVAQGSLHFVRQHGRGTVAVYVCRAECADTGRGRDWHVGCTEGPKGHCGGGTVWEGMSRQVQDLIYANAPPSIVAADLAAERSHRIVAAVLAGPVYPSEKTRPMVEKRMETVGREGMQAAVGKKAAPLAKAFLRELLLGQVPAYSKIRIPILMLAGDEDQSAPLEDCNKMFEEIGTHEKRLESMRGVGHWHCLEAFGEVVRLIETFAITRCNDTCDAERAGREG